MNFNSRNSIPWKHVNDVTLVPNCVRASAGCCRTFITMMNQMIYLYIIIPILLILFAGIRIVRPTQRGQLKRLGKYDNQVLPGLHWIILVAEPREIITKIDPPSDVQENLNKEVADKYIIENAQLLRKLEVVEASLRAGRLKSFGLN